MHTVHVVARERGRDPLPLVAVTILFALPLFLGRYQLTQFSQFALLAAAAVALDLVWGYGGVLSLGHAAFFGIGAYAMAIVTRKWGLPIPLYSGIVIGTAVAGLVAAMLGWFVFGGRVAGAYLAILTLAVSLLLQQVANKWVSLTGGFNGISGVSSFTVDPVKGYYIAVTGLVVVSCAAMWLVHSRFGRVLVALRDNEKRAQFCGFNPVSYRTVAFGISGAAAGFAGALYAQQVGFVSPDLLGFQLSTAMAIWVLVGGRGTLVGPAVGALLVNWGQSELSASFQQYYLLIIGIAFVLIVLALPGGFYRLVSPASRRLVGCLVPPRVRTVNVDTRNGGGRTGPGGVFRLEVKGLKKYFGEHRVIEGLDLRVTERTLHCLVGPNGAGKTTVLNLITGAFRATSGEIVVFGESVSHAAPHQILQRGVARKFQSPEVFPSLSVADNLLIAADDPRSGWLQLLASRRSSLDEGALRLLEANGLSTKLSVNASDLSHGEQQWLELCMALSSRPRLLLLDEPTAGLTIEESVEVGRIVRALIDEEALTILVIEHDMRFVKSAADVVTVLHQGAVLAEGTFAEVSESLAVRVAYLGGVS